MSEAMLYNVVYAGKILLVVLLMLHSAPLMAWVERRGSALMQNRLGPNRVGPFGLIQSLADAVKFIMKEDAVPGHTEKFWYLLAPIISVIPTFMTFAVIPFASSIMIDGRLVNFQVADLNVGLLYVFAVGSLGVYAIIMGGWASNNKYALLGSLRSSSQMISYELSMGLSIVGILMLFESVHLQDIVRGQAETLIQLGPIAIPKWGIFLQPLGFLIFLTALYAETNRLPFDLPEGESEIVAGYHLEYGSMKFALFQMAEYGNMLTASALVATMYFGGWAFPGQLWLLGQTGLEGMALEWARVGLEFATFMAKVVFFMWLFVWVRWTVPRFRYDQLMDLGWKVMLPLCLINIFLTGVGIYYFGR